MGMNFLLSCSLLKACMSINFPLHDWCLRLYLGIIFADLIMIIYQSTEKQFFPLLSFPKSREWQAQSPFLSFPSSSFLSARHPHPITFAISSLTQAKCTSSRFAEGSAGRGKHCTFLHSPLHHFHFCPDPDHLIALFGWNVAPAFTHGMREASSF